ncbi:MAG: 50S ribosomal protein L18 [Candidatus Zambryskibacteria bacterium RIFCSPLOWO2_02_FULL_51_21]|uniref:Large ribosomal subunit protein uL18 n=1 Tax=Candidatus Zambryskibacteria bacterium RIFCSPHIGHO2_02_FULL_43_37 TaxID=1802749 RepID=A0A1G2TGJ7_9BACT|nr:MAG: 50S ribosomal protein L18 [Candidatus Zambryskibacteria bacterium RIFCSPHIGHO2_01_FULL_52_18]OHA96425.1 MAG: 50S ribosomal protein L18 [Candidatus Zambryskibacteria bacterium RIFCSPHIGHO2_02_FULL_43_37]OHB07363.1 MAG: 50S ribosomal protein L18 [Candidatus Zambryskibacteria bacterium RIFCSPLOWO2_01_FULL_52_12]OHB11315.1 MAG: 50S ribosomal protein L18 [Candidatus Zambryskibacteria bacterium RIFCSPLOWO2_02_FULL_51_21]
MNKQSARDRKRKKIRAKISGTALRPRLSVFKSNTAVYAQLVDDAAGKTLASAKGTDAAKVGNEIAKAASVKKINSVVFDRGGYVYTGKVRALAEAAREGGLKF